MNDQRTVGFAVSSNVARCIGMLLLAHFVVVFSIKVSRGLHEDLFWLSHVALFAAGVGMLWRSVLLIATALTSVLALHTIWLCDFIGFALHGESPLGITAYLENGDFWTYAATVHHFYLAPLLLFVFAKTRRIPRETFLLSAAEFLLLTVMSRVALSPSNNVNYAHGLLSAVLNPLLDQINLLPGGAYLLVLNLVASIAFFLPTSLLLQRWATTESGSRDKNYRPALDPVQNARSTITPLDPSVG